MNNNRNNNRRRGRGNRQTGGGGQQLNRIDSRARGNAPQLLEKYRKLAHDSHLNGDRVQAEYYLQFADHYFRVLADQRSRQEEQRMRRDDRWEGSAEDTGDESGEFSVESDFPTFDQPTYHRREREDRPRDDYPRPPREPREAAESAAAQSRSGDAEAAEPEQETDLASANGNGEPARNLFEPAENPFVREAGSGRGLRPRRNARSGNDHDRPQRSDTRSDTRSGGNRGGADRGGDSDGIDPAILPPAIALTPVDAAADDAPAPVKRPRGRPRKVQAAAADDAMAAAERD